MSKNIPPGWTIERTVGAGGGGEVYLASHDDVPESPCVLKVLRKKTAPKIAQRFSSEVEAIKQLDSSHIIKILKHSTPDDELSYYAMEYHEGATSLQKLIDTGANPFANDETAAATMFIELCKGMMAYQQKEIVHRDLSPANVLVLKDKSIKIIDFGLCQIDDGQTITLTDENIGTPNYLAPECESPVTGTVDIRADLYSAGKILWAAITNRKAFAREELAFKQLSMRELYPERPMKWHLNLIFMKTIRHKPSDRAASPDDAAAYAMIVLDLIQNGAVPIEFQRQCNLCPVCRIGTLVAPRVVACEPPNQDIVSLVCDQCGFYSTVDRQIQTATIDSRTNLS